jgi:hypothetical protein
VVSSSGAEASLLLQRVLLPEDDDEAMPPQHKAPRLTVEQVAQLKEWLATGASFPEGTVLQPFDPETAVGPRDG